jgi:hypothetical protein
MNLGQRAATTVGVLCVSVLVHASDLTPAAVLPPARVAVGLSYHLGGNTIANDEVASILNRYGLRVSYSPLEYVDFGLNGGVAQMEVASLVTRSDTIGVFHGGYGFSGGGHLKLTSPFLLKNTLGFVGIVQATMFSSTNKHKAQYRGIDGAGAVGLQVRLAGFGFASAGAKVYYIRGRNKGYDGSGGRYSNVNNIRGWLALDCIPPLRGEIKGKPYFSFELSISPDADFADDVAVKEMSFSVSVGWISPQLYGEEDFDEVDE